MKRIFSWLLLLILLINLWPMGYAEAGVETPSYGYSLGKYVAATDKYHVGASLTWWNNRQYWTDGPWSIYVTEVPNGARVRQGSVINFSDKLQNANNGYPLVGSDKWDQWIAVFGGVPNYVKGQLNSAYLGLSWQIDTPIAKVKFANLSDIAVLSGGSGGTFDTKLMYSNFNRTSGPTSTLTANKTAIRAGETVTFTIKGTTNTIYNKYMLVSLAGAGTTYFTDKRIDGQNITYTQNVTLINPGNYTFSLILKDAVMRKATNKTIIVSVSPVDQVPVEPAQIPTDTVIEPPPDTPTEVNQPPIAKFDWSNSAYAGENVSVDEYSVDYDGSIVDKDWVLSTTDAINGLGGGGGKVNFNTPGDYNLELTVTDDDGAADSLTKSITVYKPLPTAIITTSGTLKENRKVILSSASSKAPASWPIDHTKDEWVIEPVSGGTVFDIKTGTKSGATQEVLFKKAGAYRVSLRVTNAKGVSDWSIQDITIGPDLAPVTDFSLNKITYRNPADTNQATITLTDKSLSSDGDTIVQRTWKYQFDSDNDGLFSDESWVTLDSTNKTTVTLITNKVGKYLFELTAKEDFGQETILTFILPGDYRTGDTSLKNAADKIINVKNIAPTTSFLTSTKPKVDIVFVHGFLKDYATRFNNMVTSLVNIVGAKLAAQGYDYAFYNTTPQAPKTGEIKTIHVSKISHPGTGDYYDQGIHQKYYSWSIISWIYFDLNRQIPKSSLVANSFKIDYALFVDVFPSNFPEHKSDDLVLAVSQDNVNWHEVTSYPVTAHGAIGYYNIKVDINKIPISDFRYVKIYLRSGNTANGRVQSFKVIFDYTAIDERIYTEATSGAGNLRLIDFGKYIDLATVSNLDIKYRLIMGSCEFEVSSDNINWYKIRTLYAWKGDYDDYVTLGIDKSTIPINNFRFLRAYIYPNYGISTSIDYLSAELIYKGPVRSNLQAIQVEAAKSYRSDAIKYLVNFTEELYIDKATYPISSTATAVNNAGANLAIFGDANSLPDTQPLVNAVTKKVLYNTTADMTTPLDQLADYVIASAPVTYTVGTRYVLLGQELGFLPAYSDYENDPKIADAWSFVHTPSYLDNNTGFSMYNNQTLVAPVAVLDKVGKYDIKYKAQDDPAAGNILFGSYRLWSDPTPTTVIVHRKPIASFTVTPGTINAVDTSYDPDLQYQRPDKGIVEWKWMWKKTTSDTWTVGEPSGIVALGDYIIHLEVKDVYGVWSDPVEKTVTVVDLNKPPVANFSWSPTVIYEGDAVTVINMSTDPDGDPLTYQWTTYDSMGATKTYTTKNIALTNVQPGNYWLTLRVWDSNGATNVITKSFIVYPLGIIGYVEHTPQWNSNRISYNQSKTGTDDNPRPYHVFFAIESFVLKANTTDTGLSTTKATSIRVDLLNIGETELLISNSAKTFWSGDMSRTYFENLADGNYTFRFTVKYSNSVVKTHDLTIVIKDSWLEYYNFHRTE